MKKIGKRRQSIHRVKSEGMQVILLAIRYYVTI